MVKTVECFGITYEYWYDRKEKVWAYAHIDIRGDLTEAQYAGSVEYALIGIGIDATRVAEERY